MSRVDVIGRDVECLACGYNLRGLRGDGVCPECGGGIAESLVDRGLDRADAGWRRTLRRGVAAGAVEYLTLMALLPLSRVGRWMVGVGPVVWAGMLVEQFAMPWEWWAWVDWTLIVVVALACAGVVGYSGWLYVVLRGRRGAVA